REAGEVAGIIRYRPGEWWPCMTTTPEKARPTSMLRLNLHFAQEILLQFLVKLMKMDFIMGS
ncbi:RIMBP2 isoform 5, partial [Pongo abelii]